MEFYSLIISFVVLMFVVCGVIIFVLRRTFITSTEGALRRLNDEISKATARQAELSRKIREADEELEKRRVEAKELADKMRAAAEEEGKAEKEKIILRAREEGEDIIAKAQNATEKLRLELEKELDLRGIDFGTRILNKVFAQKAKEAFEGVLISDFIEKLKVTDMSMISTDVKAVDIVTLNPLKDADKAQILKIIKEKLNRDVQINVTTDPKISGGIVLKFGSMALDGSLKFLFREEARTLKEQTEAKAI